MQRIEKYVAGGRDSFMESTLVQDAVMRNLQILGESTRRLSSATRAKCPGVDWRGISGFRNVMVHDYLGVTLLRVWEVVEQDLPMLRRQTEALIQGLGCET